MSYIQKLLEGADEFLRDDKTGGEHTTIEIASWLYHQRKVEPAAKSQIQLLAKDLSRAMSTQITVDEKGRRVRQKLCLRRKVKNPDGTTYVQATWFDKDFAPPSFKEAVFDQRRESATNMLWQLKQDVDHYNEFDNPGEEYQTTFDFGGDMADREAGLQLIMESHEPNEDYDEEVDEFDHRFVAAD